MREWTEREASIMNDYVDTAIGIFIFFFSALMYLVITGVVHVIVDKIVGDDDMLMAWITGMILYANAMVILNGYMR